MSFFGDEFDDDINFILGQFTNKFKRPVLDQRPFSAFRAEDGDYIVVANTLGINANDIHISLEPQKGVPYPVLTIEGKTSIPSINFENSVNLKSTLKIPEKIKGVNYKVQNGLTIVKIKVEQQDKSEKIVGTLIEDDGLDF